MKGVYRYVVMLFNAYGFGLTDGEGMGRFWSYLSGYVKPTRNMAAATRQLTLTDGVRYFALKKMNKMGGYLRRTWPANEKLMDDLECEMSKVSSDELKEKWKCVVVEIIDPKETGLTTPLVGIRWTKLISNGIPRKI
ncbi:uncharacterized protein EV154DRAFT_574351 [Mucor mucedo]|uniref:uncharacterized protein n=1 Tax=Mucor mucedo TaxID=29922 RepID=UPI00222065AD|nr:uncharacterized protein EV154DRAFT_574351 [Mucor mucedo]KAI7885932.1 hypothetical protein EV154DRAFT_574351 [Mucor mucedo]